MKPAFSVIFLTTLIGAGQGLFLALFAVELNAVFARHAAPDPRLSAAGGIVALLLCAAGLFASFFHLGRPERAWRAATQWRTSWLSREVIALPAFMGVLALYTLVHFADANPILATLAGGAELRFSTLLGLLGVVLAFALFVCTGMIYASLRFLREWHSPLTVVNFILLGSASGFTLAAGLAAALDPARSGMLVAWAAVLTLAALASHAATRVRNARLAPRSSLQTAIGIRHPRIVQKTQGAMGGSFNTREFFHGKPAEFVSRIGQITIVAVFLVPLLLLVAGGMGLPGAVPLAFLVQFAGLLAERWLFFATARHPQNLYYQCVS